MGHGDGALGYNGRDAKLSGHGGFGMECGAWNEPKRGRIIIFRRKEIGKFLEREVHVRERVGELEELGGRSQLDDVGQSGWESHLARMHCGAPLGYTLKALPGAPV
jgi:hypothetical protein